MMTKQLGPPTHPAMKPRHAPSQDLCECLNFFGLFFSRAFRMIMAQHKNQVETVWCAKDQGTLRVRPRIHASLQNFFLHFINWNRPCYC